MFLVCLSKVEKVTKALLRKERKSVLDVSGEPAVQLET
jgi:hypothetical protein